MFNIFDSMKSLISMVILFGSLAYGAAIKFDQATLIRHASEFSVKVQEIFKGVPSVEGFLKKFKRQTPK